ncbi:SETMAR [Cordylochernes scorpioides]|uniref:SETMAR n=1 Tax=Cordylochernes scorpioides TaxID=51811 RepID=A0ABY6K9E9_9ARAC|nr:SETMAR [Cordylochernes scorpioides]
MHRPGIEPGPPAWQASILATEPPMLIRNGHIWVFIPFTKANVNNVVWGCRLRIALDVVHSPLYIMFLFLKGKHAGKRARNISVLYERGFGVVKFRHSEFSLEDGVRSGRFSKKDLLEEAIAKYQPFFSTKELSKNEEKKNTVPNHLKKFDYINRSDVWGSAYST